MSNDPKKFVASLEVPDYQGEEHILEVSKGFESDQAGKPEGYVNNKSLVSFASALNGQNRRDVLNSSLLAQKAADKKFPDNSNIMDWYETYIDVLSNIGWVVESRDFAGFSSQDTVFEMENVVIDILTALVGNNYLTVIKSTLDAMKKLADDDGKVKVFEQNAHDYHKGNFQIALATEENGAVSMQIGAFMLETSERINRILFFKSGKDKSALNYYSIKCTLNEDQYAIVRNDIMKKLGKLTTSYIGNLEI